MTSAPAAGRPSTRSSPSPDRGLGVVRQRHRQGQTHLLHRRWEDDGGDNPVVRVAKVTGTSWPDTTAKENLSYS
ncbi:hypothetical protein ABZ078_43520 [Streptomyces sp. NPDC006385]|uniref:hypothetical protein n=1 Tax=Streptomyces sp. NPDC006385 TaxID=3156761 RepID=UPI0033A97EB3